MKLKYIVPLFTALFVVMGIFSGCGDDNKEAAKGETASQTETQLTTSDATPKETTVVLETTPEGGTIEKDPEENKITKDKDGNVISVEDKNGNPVDVEEYVSTHSWVQGSGSGKASSGASGSSDKNSNASSSNGSEGSSGSGSSSSDKSESKSSESPDNDIEESEIPVIIATVPNEDDITGPVIDI